jgi:choline kinase
VPDTPQHAVILAAGLGSRLGRRTASRPKCLLDVAGEPILLNALRHLEAAGIPRTTVVMGYLADRVETAVRSHAGTMQVSLRWNEDYEMTGTSHSLWIGLSDRAEDVLVLEGDVFFERQLLDDLLTAPDRNATVVAPWHPSIDGSIVELDDAGFVARWLHRSKRPEGYDPQGTWKTVNVHRFSAEFVGTTLGPALAAEVARGGAEPLETPFARIVRTGARIRAVKSSARWVEVDDERDLARAERVFETEARS